MNMTQGEHNAITRIIEALTAAGYTLEIADDGGEPDDRIFSPTVAQAIELIDSVDQSWVTFISPDGKKSTTITFILGNAPDGSEVAADWHCSDTVADGIICAAIGCEL